MRTLIMAFHKEVLNGPSMRPAEWPGLTAGPFSLLFILLDSVEVTNSKKFLGF